MATASKSIGGETDQDTVDAVTATMLGLAKVGFYPSKQAHTHTCKHAMQCTEQACYIEGVHLHMMH